MSIIQLVGVLVASLIAAALVYRAWRFSRNAEVEEHSSQKPIGGVERYRNLKRALSA